MVVLDACGCGALPDAAEYGDEETNTLAHTAEAAGGLALPALGALGLGNILELAGVAPSERPAVHGRLAPRGPGKDTTAGHWELMGVRGPDAPVYPHGFPPEVIEAFAEASGRGVLCNAPRGGLAALEEFGAEHLRTGDLIVYTSQDSVFQIAAHTSVLGEPELYEQCAAARELLRGEHAVGRVIARPFEGEPGAFRRTSGRRDYSLPPPGRSHVDELSERGVVAHSVGKVAQVFAGRGFTHDHPASDNEAGLAATGALVASLDEGFVFVNLVDTDSVHGHRRDPAGFRRALERIDVAVAGWVEALRGGDLLVLTADHGCDPTHSGSDHTREYVPLLAAFEGAGGRRHDGQMADVGASVLSWLTGAGSSLPGTSFVEG